MAERYIPDPLPVDVPTELDDEEFAAALAEGSPAPDRVFGALASLEGLSVAVVYLALGKSYQDGVISQGYYFFGAKAERAELRALFAAMPPFTSTRNDARQLALSKRYVREKPWERRDLIAGYWVRDAI